MEKNQAGIRDINAGNENGGMRCRRFGSSMVNVSRQVTGIEIESGEAEKTRMRLTELGYGDYTDSVISGDFFAYCQQMVNANDLTSPSAIQSSANNKNKYDAIVGNPPFIRYQYFPEEQRNTAFDLMRTLGLNPNKMTNAWVPFVCASLLLLNPGGRLAMVVPFKSLIRCIVSVHVAPVLFITIFGNR
ncbi:hypothetical protein ES708_31907 [subsurface metagenome]